MKDTLETLETKPKFNLDFVSQVNKRKRDLINSSKKLNLPLFTKIFLDHAKNDDHVFIGNSSVIRSFDYYINCSSTPIFMNIYTNRGVSGIEGNLATAIGICEASDLKQLSVVLGDISFLHDLSSLKALYGKSYHVKIYVLNDHQGGIFGLLPLEMNNEAKEIISSPHPFNFEKVCDQFDINYEKINEYKQLGEAITEIVDAPKIYEINIDSKENFTIYQQLKTMKS